MIKYHGTPIGGNKKDAIRFLTGRHALVSFANQQHIAEVLQCCDSFCLDNGAFTFWKKSGLQIDVKAYTQWVEVIGSHPAFDFALIPDIIGGTEEENDFLIETWQSDRTSVPVFHLSESPDRFLKLANKFETVALGSTDKWPQNGSRKWWVEMANLMDKVTDDKGRFPCKVHGLRMLNPKIFKYIPLHSGDSTNVATNGYRPMNNPCYPALSRAVGSELVAQQFEQYQSPWYWSRESLIQDEILER